MHGTPMGFGDTGALEPIELLTPEDRITLLQQVREYARNAGLTETELREFINHSHLNLNDLESL